MKEFVTIGYSYSELDAKAKERVKDWYLDTPIRNDVFHEDVMLFLQESFPNSDLEVQYSLSYCQGDGLNIYGTLKKDDFLPVWQVSEATKNRMKKYLNRANSGTFTFEYNDRYAYSCKFIDQKYIEEYVSDMVEDLQDNGVTRINTDTIRQFYTDMLDYFDDLDDKLKKKGYDYIYNCSDEEVEDACEANEWYFTKEGRFIR